MEGCPGGVTLVTDHQPLVRLMDQQVLTRIQTRWLRLGLSQSICPTIKYQSGKANVVANALSRSQRKEIEDSMDDPMATATTVEEHVSALSGFNMELTTVWKRGVSSPVALLNPRRRVQSRQLNSGELDVTPMCSSDCSDGLRSWA